MKEFDFKEILANARELKKAKESILNRTQKDEDSFYEFDLGDDLYKTEYISLTKFEGENARNKYFQNKAELYIYLYKQGYETWYIERAIDSIPTKLLSIDKDIFFYIQRIPEGLTEQGMWNIEVESDRFAYYIDEDKKIYRKTLSTGIMMEIKVKDNKVRLANSASRVSINKIWTEMRGTKND